MQYHILITRINSSLKIDLVRFCTIVDGEAKILTPDEFSDLLAIPQFSFFDNFIESSDISDSMYILHARISEFIQRLFAVSSVIVNFFDNNLVIIFDHGSEKETPEEK